MNSVLDSNKIKSIISDFHAELSAVTHDISNQKDNADVISLLMSEIETIGKLTKLLTKLESIKTSLEVPISEITSKKSKKKSK
jgi:hypothetical protein